MARLRSDYTLSAAFSRRCRAPGNAGASQPGRAAAHRSDRRGASGTRPRPRPAPRPGRFAAWRVVGASAGARHPRPPRRPNAPSRCQGHVGAGSGHGVAGRSQRPHHRPLPIHARPGPDRRSAGHPLALPRRAGGSCHDPAHPRPNRAHPRRLRRARQARTRPTRARPAPRGPAPRTAGPHTPNPGTPASPVPRASAPHTPNPGTPRPRRTPPRRTPKPGSTQAAAQTRPTRARPARAHRAARGRLAHVRLPGGRTQPAPAVADRPANAQPGHSAPPAPRAASPHTPNPGTSRVPRSTPCASIAHTANPGTPAPGCAAPPRRTRPTPLRVSTPCASIAHTQGTPAPAAPRTAAPHTPDPGHSGSARVHAACVDRAYGEPGHARSGCAARATTPGTRLRACPRRVRRSRVRRTRGRPLRLRSSRARRTPARPAAAHRTPGRHPEQTGAAARRPATPNPAPRRCPAPTRAPRRAAPRPHAPNPAAQACATAAPAVSPPPPGGCAGRPRGAVAVRVAAAARHPDDPLVRPSPPLLTAPAPASGAASAMAAVLAEVLKIRAVAVDSHFFDDLGADSMSMARFCAKLRKRPDVKKNMAPDDLRAGHGVGARGRAGRPTLVERSRRAWPPCWRRSSSTSCPSTVTSSTTWAPFDAGAVLRQAAQAQGPADGVHQGRLPAHHDHRAGRRVGGGAAGPAIRRARPAEHPGHVCAPDPGAASCRAPRRLPLRLPDGVDPRLRADVRPPPTASAWVSAGVTFKPSTCVR